MATKKKTTSEIICENFKLSCPQTIFQDYKCTLKASLTFFGRLYIGENHILFIANMFGIVKKCVIQIQKIQKVQQPAKGSVIIIEQTKLANQTIKNQYLFGSFKTDHALKLMQALWKRQKIAGDILKAQEQDTLNVSINKENLQKISIDQGKVQANFFNYQTVESQKQKIVQVQLPCSLQQYYDFFIADEAKVYSRKKHFEFKGAQNVVVTQWRKNEQLNCQIRELNGIIKVSGVPFKSQAPLSQVWMLKRPNQNQIDINIVTQMSEVPYASYFNCQQHIIVKRVQNQANRCIISAQVALIFNKSTYMKNTILGRTFADMKEDYNIWINNVKQIIASMAKKNKPIQQQDDSLKISKNKQKKHMQFEKIQADNNDILILNKLGSSFTEIQNGKSQLNLTIIELSKKINRLTWIVYIILALNFTILINFIMK